MISIIFFLIAFHWRQLNSLVIIATWSFTATCKNDLQEDQWCWKCSGNTVQCILSTKSIVCDNNSKNLHMLNLTKQIKQTSSTHTSRHRFSTSKAKQLKILNGSYSLFFSPMCHHHFSDNQQFRIYFGILDLQRILCLYTRNNKTNRLMKLLSNMALIDILKLH